MNKTRKNIVICVIIILVIVLPIIYITIDNSDIKAILLGIISSIIASAIFSILSAFVFDNKMEQAEALKQLISSIDSKLTKGVLELKDRAEFESGFWIKFAKTANKEWTISGRTLNRWLGGSIKEDFKKNIIRILKDKGEVNLVIYKNYVGNDWNYEKTTKYIFATGNDRNGQEYIEAGYFIHYIKDGNHMKEKKTCNRAAVKLWLSHEVQFLCVFPYYGYSCSSSGRNI